MSRGRVPGVPPNTAIHTYYRGNNIQETPYNRVEQSDWLEYLDGYMLHRESPRGIPEFKLPL